MAQKYTKSSAFSCTHSLAICSLSSFMTDFLFSRCSYIQLLSSDLHNFLFLISHLPAESVFFLLYFCLASFLLLCHRAFHHAVTRPIHLCLWYHIVFKIFLSSWIMCKISSFVFLSFQLIFSILLQIHISKASSLLLSACINVHVSAAYSAMLQTKHFIICFFNSSQSFLVHEYFLSHCYSIMNFLLTISVLWYETAQTSELTHLFNELSIN